MRKGRSLDETLATNPFKAIVDAEALAEARRGRQTGGRQAARRGLGRTPPRTPVLTMLQQESRIAEAGLAGQIDLYEGETAEGLDMRIRWRQDELARQAVMTASENGVLPTLASFGTAFAGSLIDPINIASGFVPVISAGRYANLLANAGGRAGRLSVRARVGAAEGLVGAVAVEPIVLAGADLRQADYGLYDSMLNLLLGTALGGGLHGAGGAVADAVRGPRAIRDLDAIAPEARVEAMRAGVAAVVEGRKPIVVASVVANEQPVSSAADGPPEVLGGTSEAVQRARETDRLGESGGGADAPSGIDEMAITLRDGTEVVAPDVRHAALLRLADDIEAGRSGPEIDARREEVFRLFDGFVEDQPDYAQPFSRLEHVDLLAEDYLFAARDAPESPGSVVDPDLEADFVRSLVRSETLDAALLRAQEPGNRLYAKQESDLVRETQVRGEAGGTSGTGHSGNAGTKRQPRRPAGRDRRRRRRFGTDERWRWKGAQTKPRSQKSRQRCEAPVD